jgi:hypothetical protein
MDKYAVNICDLDECNPRNTTLSIVGLLLADFCTAESLHFFLNDKVDSGVVVLDGPAAQDEERLNALIELLQTVVGPRKIKRRVRCYKQGPRGGWNEVRPVKKATKMTVERAEAEDAWTMPVDEGESAH